MLKWKNTLNKSWESYFMKLKTYGPGRALLQNPTQQRGRSPMLFSSQNIIFLAKLWDNLGVNLLLSTVFSWVFLNILEKWVRARKSIIIVKATIFPETSEAWKDDVGHEIHSSFTPQLVLSYVHCTLFIIFHLLWIRSEITGKEATLQLYFKICDQKPSKSKETVCMPTYGLI